MRVGTHVSFQAVVKLIDRFAHLNWALADQMVISAANFATGLLLVRYLGVELFGQYSLAWVIILFVQGIQVAAVSSPMMSIGPKESEEKIGTYYAVVFAHQLLFALLSTTIVFALVLVSSLFWQEWNLGSLIWPVTAILFVSQIQDFLRRYFFTINRAHISFAIDFVRYAGQVAILAWLLMLSQRQTTLPEVFWILIATAVAAVGLALWFVEGLKWSAGAWKEISIRHWHFAKWLVGSSILSWASGDIIYVLAAGALGTSAVGILKAAQNVMSVTNVFFLALGNFLPMRASIAYRDGGIARLREFVRKASLFVILLTGVVALFVGIFAYPIMELLYGAQMREYGWVLIGFALIYVLMAISHIIPFGLLALERTFPIVLSHGCAAAVSILAAFPLMRWWGLAGAIVVVLVSEAVRLLIRYVAFQRLVSGGGDVGEPATQSSSKAPL